MPVGREDVTDADHDAVLAAKVDDADVFTEEERDNIARIAVALNMSPARWEGVGTSELHRAFISLLNKTKALRAHVDDADRQNERALKAARYLRFEIKEHDMEGRTEILRITEWLEEELAHVDEGTS